jgi:paired amphipathic helix protein Sin3a
VWQEGLGRFCEDFKKCQGHSDLFRCIVPLCGDDADLLECFYRVMRACEAPSSVASQSPDSRDKDVKNSGAVLIKAGEERKKQHPEKIEVAQGNDKERNFVRGFAVKPGDHVVKKLLQAGFLLFENFRKKLSCEISYYTLLKMVFYYINGRIGKYEWKERIVAMIRKHPGLMDEFQRYVIDISQQTMVFLLNTMQCNPN